MLGWIGLGIYEKNGGDCSICCVVLCHFLSASGVGGSVGGSGSSRSLPTSAPLLHLPTHSLLFNFYQQNIKHSIFF